MFKPTRWLLGVVVGAMALTALGAGVVGAKPKGGGKKESGVVYAAITHPVAPTKEDVAGNTNDSLFGAGAITYVITIGTPAAPGKPIPVKATVIVFFKNGSLSGKATADAVVNSDGSATYTNGKIKLTHGGGAFKGHGFAGTFTGTEKTANVSPFTFHYTGTYK
jgi:hypothetical protein